MQLGSRLRIGVGPSRTALHFAAAPPTLTRALQAEHRAIQAQSLQLSTARVGIVQYRCRVASWGWWWRRRLLAHETTPRMAIRPGPIT